MVKTFSKSIVIGLISVLVLAQPQEEKTQVLAQPQEEKTQRQNTTPSPSPPETPTPSPDPSAENTSKSSPPPSKTPTQETSSFNPSSLFNPSLIISMISLIVGLSNLIVLIYFLRRAFPEKYKSLLGEQSLLFQELDSIQESLKQSRMIGTHERTKILEYVSRNDQQLSNISQQILQALGGELYSRKPQTGQSMPKNPRQGIVDYQSVIDQFNANNSDWFREQIGLGFFQKVQANESLAADGIVIQISLQPRGSLLKYKVNGTEWVIPDLTQERWYRTIDLLFLGFQSSSSSLIRPAELERRGTSWQVKELGQFQ